MRSAGKRGRSYLVGSRRATSSGLPPSRSSRARSGRCWAATIVPSNSPPYSVCAPRWPCFGSVPARGSVRPRAWFPRPERELGARARAHLVRVRKSEPAFVTRLCTAHRPRVDVPQTLGDRPLVREDVLVDTQNRNDLGGGA